MTHESRQQRDADGWGEPSRHGVPDGYLDSIYNFPALRGTQTTPAGSGHSPERVRSDRAILSAEPGSGATLLNFPESTGFRAGAPLPG